MVAVLVRQRRWRFGIAGSAEAQIELVKRTCSKKDEGTQALENTRYEPVTDTNTVMVIDAC